MKALQILSAGLHSSFWVCRKVRKVYGFLIHLGTPNQICLLSVLVIAQNSIPALQHKS